MIVTNCDCKDYRFGLQNQQFSLQRFSHRQKFLQDQTRLGLYPTYFLIPDP